MWIAQAVQNQAVEIVKAIGAKFPTQVLLTGLAQGNAPGIAREPCKRLGWLTDFDTAVDPSKTANVKTQAVWIGETMGMCALYLDSVLFMRYRLTAHLAAESRTIGGRSGGP